MTDPEEARLRHLGAIDAVMDLAVRCQTLARVRMISRPGGDQTLGYLEGIDDAVKAMLVVMKEIKEKTP